jgi:multiple sugar transport system substrate-binding protein
MPGYDQSMRRSAMAENEKAQRVSRRRFLQIAGTSAALAALAACTPQTPTTTTQPAAPAQKPAEAKAPSAPAVIAKPFAGKELNVFSGVHHDGYVKETYIPMFQEKTGAKVNYTSIGFADIDAKYAVFVASQDGSQDVLYSWETLNAKYGRTLMEDLTDKVPAKTVEGLVAPAAKAFSFLGKRYGIPLDSNIFIFMWNKDLYKAAGLDDSKAPANWAQFVEYSKKLTTGGKYATMFTFGDGNAAFATFAPLFNTTGMLLLNEDLTKMQLDNANGLMVMQAIYDAVIKDKIVDPNGLSIAGSIEQGKVFRAGNFAHYIAAPNHFTLTMDPTQSQVVGKAASGIIPGLKERSGSLGLFEGYAVNKFSKNKEMGLAFLEHMISPEVQKQVAMKWGRPPSLNTMFDDAEVQKASPQFAIVREQAKYPAPRYGSPFYFDLGNIFNEHMQRMFKDEKSVPDTVKAIQTESQKVIDAYWAKVK